MRKVPSSIISRLPSRVLPAKSSAFSGIRTFAFGAAKVPQILSKKMTSRLCVDPYTKLIMPPQAKVIEKMAAEAKMLLEESVTNDSANRAEAEAFLHAIEAASRDSKITALNVSGLPQGNGLEVYCSAVVAHLMGYEVVDGKGDFVAIAPIVKIISPYSTVAIDPHQDVVYHGKRKVDLLSFVGIESYGEVQTYVIEVEKILEKLSLRDKELLSKPLYITEGYRQRLFGGVRATAPKRGDDTRFAILRKNEDGATEMFLDQDLYGFDHYRDPATIPKEEANISEEEANAAIKNLSDTINSMKEKGEIEAFVIDKGSMLMVFNHRCLHGRDKGEDPVREVDIVSFTKLAGQSQKSEIRLA